MLPHNDGCRRCQRPPTLLCGQCGESLCDRHKVYCELDELLPLDEEVADDAPARHDGVASRRRRRSRPGRGPDTRTREVAREVTGLLATASKTGSPDRL